MIRKKINLKAKGFRWKTFSLLNENNKAEMSIVSATYGQVSEIKENSIVVYIDVKDIHKIYAPITSKIIGLDFVNGLFKRKVFKSIYMKTGRAIITLKGIIEIKFYLEVGKPKYITDRVLIENSIGDNILQGQIIGEILLGSLSEIFFPKNIPLKILINEGDYIEGGKTILAYYNSDETVI